MACGRGDDTAPAPGAPAPGKIADDDAAAAPGSGLRRDGGGLLLLRRRLSPSGRPLHRLSQVHSGRRRPVGPRRHLLPPRASLLPRAERRQDPALPPAPVPPPP